MALANDDELMGLEIVDFDPETGLQQPTARAYRVRYGWRGASLTDRFEQLMADPRVGELRALVIGMWEHGGSDDVPGMLRAAAPKLTSLEALFVGDISYEESEVSWIEQFDLGAVINAFPKLKHFKARGGNGLGFTGLSHPTLETLIVETGGVSGHTVRQIVSAKLPNLQHLEIWTGSSEYGADVTVEDVKPLLVGTAYPEMRYPFPKLKRLGLVNSELADELAEALFDAPVLDFLEELDLSKGIMSNTGAGALARNPKIGKLKSIDITNNFIGDEELIDQLRATGVTVRNGGQRRADDDDDYWYVEVGE
jgi:hypothetical protein